MIKYKCFSNSNQLSDISKKVKKEFCKISCQIDSGSNSNQPSNIVLSKVCSGLKSLGFDVETSKKKTGLVTLTVSYGLNKTKTKNFDVDAYSKDNKYIVEVEAGRAVCNYQFLKDFFEACVIDDVDKLCIAVRNNYRGSDNYGKVCEFFEILYDSKCFNVPLSELLIIGY